MTETIESSLRRFAEQQRDKPLVVGPRRTMSYGAVWQSSVRAAHWLIGQGVRRGDRVIVTVSRKDVSFVIGYVGIHLAGAIAVPVDEKAGGITRASIVDQVDASLVLTEKILAGLAETPDDSALDRLAGKLPPVDDHAPADIVFTTGTTGLPKGVVLTHRAIAAAAENINAFIKNGAEDKEIVTIPLGHSFGLGRLRCTMLAGGTLILVPGLTFPPLVFRALESHRATGLACVPTGIAVLLKNGPEKLAACASHLRYIEIGSAPLPLEVKETLMQVLPNTRICMHYGLTEASRSSFLEFHSDAEHLDSVGRPSPNVEIEIHDGAGRPLPPRQVGRIKIRAESVMKAYWDNPELTASTISPDGWLDTGDVGTFDAQGYLHLKARADEVINVGGRKVYPVSVERAAAEHPGVAETACIGVPDPDGLLGEVPVLFVVCHEPDSVGEVELREFLADSLDPHALPRTYRFVEAVPKTSSGKLRRGALRDQLGGTA